jgi:hypothetical protein
VQKEVEGQLQELLGQHHKRLHKAKNGSDLCTANQLFALISDETPWHDADAEV